MPGHLFIARASLTRLACDAVFLGCDADLNISDVWRDLLPRDLPRGDVPTWSRLPSEHAADGLVRLPHKNEDTQVNAIVTDFVYPDPASVVSTVEAGVRSATVGLTSKRRDVPLIGLPLIGSEAGGLGSRRGEVIADLIPALSRVAAQNSVEIALCLLDPRDLAAAQIAREEGHWPELSTELAAAADELGCRASQGDLSLFLGAGLSIPVGLPSWGDLVAGLANKLVPPFPFDATTDDLIEVAASVVERLGKDPYHSEMRDRLSTQEHGLGHALLANLGVTQVVTTNFDHCYEHALDHVHGTTVTEFSSGTSRTEENLGS